MRPMSLGTDEGELAYRTALLQAQMEASIDGLLVVDPGGRMTAFNQRFAEIWGMPDDVMASGSDEAALQFAMSRLSDPGEFIRRVQELYAGRGSGRDEIRFSDGQLFERFGRPVVGEDGMYYGYLWSFRDRTQHERAAAEQRATAAALVEADRRKDEFMAVLAHELRNPLTPALNAAEMLERGVAQDQQVRIAGIIGRQMRHMSRLVDDLLDVSRISSGKIDLRPEPVDLSPLVGVAVEDNRATIERGGRRVSADIPSTPLVVRGDPVRLSQIIENLLVNAARYTNDNGRVEVVLRNDNDAALLLVRDDGVGIDPAFLPRMFEPFAQADDDVDRRGGGLGLGLALVRGLAELHGGTVEASSDGPGQGAQFRVALPLMDPVAADGRPGPEPPERIRARIPRRVLVVDDNVDLADVLKLVLEDAGHEVQIAHSAASALALVRQAPPDIVLCDLGLAGVSGHEVARELRHADATRHVRLVALTGYGRSEDREEALAAGFHEHLIKPVPIDRLLTVIEGAAEETT